MCEAVRVQPNDGQDRSQYRFRFGNFELLN